LVFRDGVHQVGVIPKHDRAGGDMIDEDPDLDRRYRAPRVFGPLPGPRNIPLSQRGAAGGPEQITTSLSVSLDADPAELSRLLPPDTRLAGRAVLTVTATRFENVSWLAGRGYAILAVTFPVTSAGAGPGEADFLAVLWENLADPITTGREELGFPKLFADIHAEFSATSGAGAHASWDGFRFCDLMARDLRKAPPDGPAEAPARGTLVHRFVPALGSPGRADIDQLVHYPPAAGAPALDEVLSGTGRFSFHHATFADVPVQYPVINALAALSLGSTGPARLTRTIGTPGASTPRTLGGSTEAPR
jgi:hypothetical protein